jgi:hypothetical protein
VKKTFSVLQAPGILALIIALCSMFLADMVRAQDPLGWTDYGKSQNTQEDIMNSLVPARPNLTKGEKKQEVDPKTLQSKPAKDPMFQGGLMDVGLDWTGQKMGKPHTTTERDSKPDKKSEAAGEKDSKAAHSSTESTEKPSKSSSPEPLPLQIAISDPQANALAMDQKAASAKSDKKPTEKSDQDANKDSARKSDSDH